MDSAGQVTGVRYYRTGDDGRAREEFQKARAVVVAGYAIETPRLLLNSTSSRFPQGLANSSGVVGKFLMAQAGPVVWGRFDEMVRQYKAPPACACTEEFYETDPRNDFVRGYALQTVSPLPIAMAHVLTGDGAFGADLLAAMRDYNHYAAVGVLGEILPDARNYVSLHPTARDAEGVPAPYVHFNLFENDERMMRAGIARAQDVLLAAGARSTQYVRRYAHLVGTCRMGASPREFVVDQWCRSWDVPNLFVCDGSVLPTQGSANPALTISALAARTAETTSARPRGGGICARGPAAPSRKEPPDHARVRARPPQIPRPAAGGNCRALLAWMRPVLAPAGGIRRRVGAGRRTRTRPLGPSGRPAPARSRPGRTARGPARRPPIAEAKDTTMPTFHCTLSDPPTPLRHAWEHTVGSGHAPLALRGDWQAQLRRCHEELGFRHVRFHGLLDDDMGTLICQNDEYLYSFFNADQIWDFLLSIGMRPFVELSFMPRTLASDPQDRLPLPRQRHARPRTTAQWATLIRKLVRPLGRALRRRGGARSGSSRSGTSRT